MKRGLLDKVHNSNALFRFCNHSKTEKYKKYIYIQLD